jgi:hypothetical protein
MSILNQGIPKKIGQTEKDNYMAKIGRTEFCKKISASQLIPIRPSSKNK